MNDGGYDDEHDQFRTTVRGFIGRSVTPHLAAWDAAGKPDRSFFTDAGELGLLGFSIPEAYGGPGIDDFRFSAILIEELARSGASALAAAIALQNDVVLPYLLTLGTDAQLGRWLPGVVSGEVVLAIAMTEPGTGSDLAGIRTTARRGDNRYLVNGAKTFISNGQNADLFVVAVRTGEHPHRDLSLLLVPRDTPGFEVGRILDKIGFHAQDTSELAFVDAVLPADHLLGTEGGGFAGLMSNLPQERLVVACMAIGAAEGTLARTLDYVKSRHAFGQPVGSFQNSRFALAEMATELAIGRTYLDSCVSRHLRRRFTGEDAAMAKWWTTDLQFRVAHRCLQLHGGYGYMRDYQVAHDFVDARIQSIYGGTNEIMKEIIGRSLGL